MTPSDYVGKKARKAIPYRELVEVMKASLDKCKDRARYIREHREQLTADGIYDRKVLSVRIERLIVDQIRWRISHLRWAPSNQNKILPRGEKQLTRENA